MRFKFDVMKWVLLSTALYILYLGFSSQLTLYIHPRYLLFTGILSGLAVAILVTVRDRPTRLHRVQLSTALSYLPLVIVISSALLLPARSLTSATVTQRTVDSSIVANRGSSGQIDALFSGSTKSFDLADWSRLVQINPDPDYYTNKAADISGFVYDAGLGDDTVWLARFVLTCCAVDAQPVGVPVYIKDWKSSYSEDEWLQITGEFRQNDTLDGAKITLIPDTIEQIAEPGNPYAN